MKSFFIAATGQNVGKTTTCLGLVSGLKKRKKSIGFMKPVGQEHIKTETGVRIDKDVFLFKNTFNLKDSYEEMSPILFPKGFTRDYLDKQIDYNELTTKILKGYASIQKSNQVTIIEGTGHTAVGSIVNLNNAQVAALLKTPIILIAPGGLGSSFDELFLNYVTCEKYHVRVAGVILNRVLEEKREMILNYMSLALKRWNVPLLGAVPYHPFLSSPTMSDFEILFKTELLSGSEYDLCHFDKILIAATSLETFRSRITSNQLIITPAVREDIILSILTRFWDSKISHLDEEFKVGMILTGKKPPKDSIISQIRRAKIPMLYIPLSSFVAMKMINSYTLKIRKDDRVKIKEAISVVEKHIDFEKLEITLQK